MAAAATSAPARCTSPDPASFELQGEQAAIIIDAVMREFLAQAQESKASETKVELCKKVLAEKDLTIKRKNFSIACVKAVSIGILVKHKMV